MTSHDVVGRCRRIFGTRKVGHAGTLDPMATGVLVIGIERATKILGLVTATASPTRPPSGWVRPRPPTTPKAKCCKMFRPTHHRRQIEAGIADLRGEIAQVPSTVSAIKVDGQRAYRLAREGHAVELAAGRCASTGSRCWRCGAADRWSMSTSRWTARREPTSARWPAISARRWASGAT